MHAPASVERHLGSPVERRPLGLFRWGRKIYICLLAAKDTSAWPAENWSETGNAGSIDFTTTPALADTDAP